MPITPNMTPRKKRSEHYVNNKEFLAALIDYRTNVEVSYMKVFKEDLTLLDKSERAKQWEGNHLFLVTLENAFLRSQIIYHSNQTL